MDITSETNTDGLIETRFDLKVGSEIVPGVCWTPEGATGPRPKVLFGHGGTQHKRVAHIPAFARRLAADGWASVAIDAPGHGDRIPAEERNPGRLPQLSGAELKRRAAMAVEEWQATIDAVEKIDTIGAGPTGYWGVSMGTMFGVPLLAVEKRIQCAVLGLMGIGGGGRSYPDKARAITIPLQFMLQTGDELVSLDSGIDLYDAFGSAEKMMAVNPGAHAAVPPFMFELNQAFYRRHLSA